MTNEIKPEKNPNYKQVYVAQNRAAPYTSARIGYDDYLQTNVWKKLRDARLVKDKCRCQVCKTGINVQVHHRRYPKVWGLESVEDDLITLCDNCHKFAHENDIASKQQDFAPANDDIIF